MKSLLSQIMKFGVVGGICEYYGALTPQVRQAGNRLSGSRKPLVRSYSRSVLSNPYTSRIEMSCSASMLVMLMR